MTDTMRTPLHLNAFVMNTNSHIHHGQWRRPDAGQVDFNDVSVWIRLAKMLEEAKFDAMFFADVFEGFVREVLPTLLARGLARSDSGPGTTLREQLFGEPRLNERHPAAKYRGAFGARADAAASAAAVPVS